MFSRIFIERPRLAVVVSIVLTLAGFIALLNIPVAQYPQITPPEIRVTATYPGANAKVVADNVAAPIEKEINGVDKMLYMSSSCSNNGQYTLAVTFEVSTDPDIDQVNLHNRCTQTIDRHIGCGRILFPPGHPGQAFFEQLRQPKYQRCPVTYRRRQ